MTPEQKRERADAMCKQIAIAAYHLGKAFSEEELRKELNITEWDWTHDWWHDLFVQMGGVKEDA